MVLICWVLAEWSKVRGADSRPRGLGSGHKWGICVRSFLRPSSSLVLSSGKYLFLSGGKELTPLPPQEEKSSSPSPLPTLGPLWGANGEGDDTADKDLPAAAPEGSGGDGGGAPLPCGGMEVPKASWGVKGWSTLLEQG